jgi:hypothetical protein
MFGTNQTTPRKKKETKTESIDNDSSSSNSGWFTKRYTYKEESRPALLFVIYTFSIICKFVQNINIPIK